jgi:hypothetical protein
MTTFDSGRQRYSMNFYTSHQRPLQLRRTLAAQADLLKVS